MLRDSVVRLWRLYHTPHGKRLFRYSMVSVISTLTTFVVLGTIFYGLRLWSEVPDNVIANIVGILPSYYLNRSWAWGKRGKSHLWREVVPFWLMSFAGIALAIGVGALAHHVSVDVLHLHRLGRTAVLYGANLFAFGVLWVLKFLIISRLFHVHPVQEAVHEAVHELEELEPAAS
ncbi:MAG TPA: GtrA family protein [Acidimicrobiales bacterium]|nr:GtrA family protein [Acidimicrobiales bacterium]